MNRAATRLAEIDLVQVGLEDLSLRVSELQPDSDSHLAKLACPGAGGREPDVLDQLLGQRASALDDAALLRVLEGCACDAHRIDTRMYEETPILSDQHGVDQVLGEIFQCQQLTRRCIGAPEDRKTQWLQEEGVPHLAVRPRDALDPRALHLQHMRATGFAAIRIVEGAQADRPTNLRSMVGADGGVRGIRDGPIVRPLQMRLEILGIDPRTRNQDPRAAVQERGAR